MSALSSIHGTITDHNNDPLSGVLVSANGEQSDKALTTVSGELGQFSLDEIPAGGYLLSASMNEYMDWKKPVVVESDQATTVSITMYAE